MCVAILFSQHRLGIIYWQSVTSEAVVFSLIQGLAILRRKLILAKHTFDITLQTFCKEATTLASIVSVTSSSKPVVRHLHLSRICWRCQLEWHQMPFWIAYGSCEGENFTLHWIDCFREANSILRNITLKILDGKKKVTATLATVVCLSESHNITWVWEVWNKKTAIATFLLKCTDAASVGFLGW